MAMTIATGPTIVHDDGCAGHMVSSLSRGPQRLSSAAPISLNLRVCSVSAISVGSRSMLEAP